MYYTFTASHCSVR